MTIKEEEFEKVVNYKYDKDTLKAMKELTVFVFKPISKSLIWICAVLFYPILMSLFLLTYLDSLKRKVTYKRKK